MCKPVRTRWLIRRKARWYKCALSFIVERPLHDKIVSLVTIWIVCIVFWPSYRVTVRHSVSIVHYWVGWWWITSIVKTYYIRSKIAVSLTKRQKTHYDCEFTFNSWSVASPSSSTERHVTLETLPISVNINSSVCMKWSWSPFGSKGKERTVRPDRPRCINRHRVIRLI